MRLRKHQQGMTFFGLAFTLLLIGFVVFTALKLLPPYMQNFYVRGALQSTETDDAAEYSRAAAVRIAILKRLDINDVTQVKAEDVSVVRDGAIFNIDIDYEVVVPFVHNISLLINFENHAEVPAQ